jgi:hypothetical protein
MSEEKTYYIDLQIGIEFTGDDIPCEETILIPIKRYIKDHIKAYKKTCKIVIINSKICQAEYEGGVHEEN